MPHRHHSSIADRHRLTSGQTQAFNFQRPIVLRRAGAQAARVPWLQWTAMFDAFLHSIRGGVRRAVGRTAVQGGLTNLDPGLARENGRIRAVIASV